MREAFSTCSLCGWDGGGGGGDGEGQLQSLAKKTRVATYTLLDVPPALQRELDSFYEWRLKPINRDRDGVRLRLRLGHFGSWSLSRSVFAWWCADSSAVDRVFSPFSPVCLVRRTDTRVRVVHVAPSGDPSLFNSSRKLQP